MFTKKLKQKESEYYMLSNKYWVLIFLSILSIGAYSTFLVGQRVYRDEVSMLINRAETISSSIGDSDIKNLSGDMSDLDKESYQRLKTKMINLKLVNPDSKFIYIMGYPDKYSGEDNKKMFFFVDSENVDSEDYSAPGDIYEETSQKEIDNFINGKSFVEGPYTDKWGSWVSGYSPVFDQNTGKVLAVVGIDIDSKKWISDIRFAQALPASITFSIILIFISYYLSQKRKAISLQRRIEFVSIASHQLKNPLSGIKWSTELLLNNKIGDLNEEQRTYVSHIYDSNERMIGLIDDLLKSSNLDESKDLLNKQPFNLVGLIKIAENDLRGLLKEKNISLFYTPDFPIEKILPIDYKKIQEVVTNLISNAIKYSHDNGRIYLDIKEDDKNIVFSIKDDGVGIPVSSQKRVFDRFFRAENASKNAPDGNGLGLYIAKRIVDKHGGRLYFESIENKGTTFFVELPKN